MMNALILERELKIWTGRVVGTVATACHREDLLPVLLRAGDEGSTSAEDVAEHLFFSRDGRKRLAERLLVIAERLDLMERRSAEYVLTEAGQIAARSERVFVPRDGAWTIWATSDPVLPSPILRIDPWQDGSAFEEVRKNGEKKPGREFATLPGFLSADRKPKLAAATGSDVRIDRLEKKVAPAHDEGDQLRLRWNVTEATLGLTGRLNGKRVDADLDPPPISGDDVWRALLEGEGLWRRWDRDRQALRTAYADTRDLERRAMARDLALVAPGVPDCGRFERTEVKAVPLLPASVEDAALWARWRLAASVDRYATGDRFETWREQAAAPFDEFDVQLPSRAALCEALAGDDLPRSINPWHLRAAEDWRL